ncbi:Fc receptor-like protein 2 [Trichosurus vulpecula]|uniref:Fc receptor-like protein 2 n=1 Tax=Trichosurus vulpecula TaxID=9337 RepID=UPI00186B0AC5|nr:Fc receptor-like protein 2 [Trichosurus vulpecula]
MLLWALLLMLGLVSRQASFAKKAVVYLSPPWTTIFQGEKVTLTCHGFNSSKPGTTWWYKNQRWQNKWSTNSIETNQTGKYACQTQDSDLSDPVNLVVSSDPLILQTPYSVFEGDTLVLRCRGRDARTARNVTYYKDGSISSYFLRQSDFSIPQVGLSYSGNYHCTGVVLLFLFSQEKSSSHVQLQVQELFPPPELKITTSEPIEGTSVTLSCETQLPPQRSDTKLHFSFFRNSRVIASGWKKSQVLQIPAIWREDSGLYWCEAKAMTQNIWKQSNHVKISVKSIPISGIVMETQPSSGQVTEGEKLVLICSIAQGTGSITFSWHREGINTSLGEKTRHSLEEKFVLSAVNESDAGKYYCTANNGINTISSQRVNVTVQIPVSHPILTLSAAGMQAIVGEVLQFQCEVLKGSAPIFYQFYHKGLVLKTILAPFGGAVSFNLSVTTEHSGDYSCKANDSFSSQLSEMLELSILDPAERGLLIMGVVVSLLGILGLVAIAILVYFKLKRKGGRSPVSEPSRDRPITDPQESGHSNSVPPVELQPIYDNVTPFIEDVVYTEVWNMQHGKINTADTSETLPEDKDSVTYSEVKTHSPNDSRGKDKSMDRNHEDGTENYENILLS